VEILVEIEDRRPPGDTTESDADFMTRARQRSADLADQGYLKASWRIPTTRCRLTLWDVSDLSELHRLLMSLPGIQHTEVRVRPIVPRGNPGHAAS
jgi:muconolactone delta-isomerase